MDLAQVNVWLALWGLVGPVFVAGASTWYNRRNQVADRKFNAEWDLARRQEDRESAHQERAQADAVAALKWRRETLINFLSASYDYVYKGNGAQEAEVRERHRERFAMSYATLMVLDSVAIGKEAQDLWNACVWFTTMAPADPQGEARAHELMASRDRFIAKASLIIADQIHATFGTTEPGRPAAPSAALPQNKAGPC